MFEVLIKNSTIATMFQKNYIVKLKKEAMKIEI